jgi:hypoxanthine phosphoribosyltransferase
MSQLRLKKVADTSYNTLIIKNKETPTIYNKLYYKYTIFVYPPTIKKQTKNLKKLSMKKSQLTNKKQKEGGEEIKNLHWASLFNKLCQS